MFLTDKKLEKRIAEIEQYRYRDIIHLEEFAVQEDKHGAANPVVPTNFDGWDTMRVGDYWSGSDQYLWMHKEVEIPKEWEEKKVLGLFDCGSTGPQQGSFEFMCYLNETMYQGVDENHKEVFLDNSLCGEKVRMTFRLWSGFDMHGFQYVQEHKFRRADIAWLDETVDDFYYMSSMIH